MRDCNNKGYHKGTTILADVGKQILGQQRLMKLECAKGGFDMQIAPIQSKINDLEKQRD